MSMQYAMTTIRKMWKLGKPHERPPSKLVQQMLAFKDDLEANFRSWRSRRLGMRTRTYS